MPKLALIDYGSGNLHSVRKALETVGAEVRIAETSAQMADANGVVLPGVGAFGDCARGLDDRGLRGPLAEWMASGRPFLGICVGYQLLFDRSDESPGAVGFGYLPGVVRRFAGGALKVPQIGWNALALTRPEHPLWAGLPTDPYVYFVHSYFPVPYDPALALATSDYGEVFAAAAGRDRVWGVQFHPEKSQGAGLRILGNFVRACAAR